VVFFSLTQMFSALNIEQIELGHYCIVRDLCGFKFVNPFIVLFPQFQISDFLFLLLFRSFRAYA